MTARQYVEASVKEAAETSVHGNLDASIKPQHGYEIIEKETGDVKKTGISSHGPFAYWQKLGGD